jgi:hypothetical protein
VPTVKSQVQADEPGIIAQWRGNRTGFAGLILSVVQLLMHATWIGVTETLAARGDLKDLSADNWQAWLIVLLLITSAVTTMVAMFLALHGTIHGRPRTPAIIGLVLSFFCGTLITFALLFNALASGAPA